jgi:heme exporter protein A
MGMSVARLQVTGLAAVRGGRPVFDGIGFTVGAGELLAVTGHNGAGKSTLLRVLAGLLRPTAGEIVIDGAGDGADGSLVHYLGHLDGLKRSLTVEENLVFWRRLWGGGGAVGDALAAVDLEPLLFLPASALSAGPKRRVAIARLLVANRPIWLLDEPTSTLDAAAEKTLGRLIQQHLDNGGITVAATHRQLPLDPTATLDLKADG